MTAEVFSKGVCTWAFPGFSRDQADQAILYQHGVGARAVHDSDARCSGVQDLTES